MTCFFTEKLNLQKMQKRWELALCGNRWPRVYSKSPPNSAKGKETLRRMKFSKY